MLLDQEFLMDAHHQHLFVVGAVENTDAAALRKALGRAPQEVMVQFFGRRLLEARNFAALRIYSRKNVADHAILACRVHGLKDKEQRPLILGVEFCLPILHQSDVAFVKLSGSVLGEQILRVCRVEVFEAERFSVVHTESAGELGSHLADLHTLGSNAKLAEMQRIAKIAEIAKNCQDWRFKE